MKTILPVKVYDDDQTTADEKDNHVENPTNSNNSSDVEIDYDEKHSILKTKLNDRFIDIKFNKDCKTKEEALNIMLVKYLENIEAKRKSSASQYQKCQNDDDMKQRTKNTKAAWYQQNKEYLRQQQLDRYKNDPEFRQRVNDKNKRAYDKKNDGIEKQKRGRKQLDKSHIIEIEKNPRGRPKRVINTAI
jgi:hypothetical protein